MHTSFSTPAAELFIEVKRSRTMTQLDIRQPLSDDVQYSRDQSDSGADNCNDEPSLPSVIRLAHFAPPTKCAFLIPEPRPISSLRPSSRLFLYSILDPINRCKILISLYFPDLIGNRVRMAIVVGWARVNRRGDR